MDKINANQKENIKSLLQDNLPFWNNIDEEDKLSLINASIIKDFDKGSIIKRGDEECLGLIFIISGQLRAFILSEDGRDITLYRLFEQDSCIMSASCLLENISFDIFIETISNTKALIISPIAFNNISNKNKYAKEYSQELINSRFSDVMWTMQQILFASLDKRLAIFLWDEITKNKTNTINFTHEQIAKYIGSAREAVSRMLKYFSVEKIVSVSRGDITIIDKKKLHDIAFSTKKQ